MNEEDLKKVYLNSSVSLESSRVEYLSDGASKDRKEFYKLKYMAAIIQNDLSREYYNLESNPSTDTSIILALGPLILKLVESHHWYMKIGNIKLRELASRRGVAQEVNEKLRNLKDLKSGRIECYSKYRSRISGHYASDFFDLLEELGSEGSDSFFEDAVTVLKYGNGWVSILKFVAETTKSENTVEP